MSLPTLSDDAEVLFRQIHPSFFDGDLPSSQGFHPTPKDQNKLSVDRSTITTAAAAFSLFTIGNASRAVYGLTVKEFGEEEILCFSDPIKETSSTSANIAHAYADYSNLTGSQQKIKAKRLKIKAIGRGRLHP